MIGPVMIGPSSSHTGGVARIGRAARHLFGQQPESVVVTFFNSFARTYEGHGSDKAVIAGLLDLKPDDERLKQSLTLAQEAQMHMQMKAVMNASALHPNSVRIEMKAGDRSMSVRGVSRGGGIIAIVDIDGFKCNFSTASPTLMITAKDIHGSVAFISSVISQEQCNIATMTVNRRGKHDTAKLVYELDSDVRPLTQEYLRSLHWIQDVIYLDVSEQEPTVPKPPLE